MHSRGGTCFQEGSPRDRCYNWKDSQTRVDDNSWIIIAFIEAHNSGLTCHWRRQINDACNSGPVLEPHIRKEGYCTCPICIPSCLSTTLLLSNCFKYSWKDHWSRCKISILLLFWSLQYSQLFNASWYYPSCRRVPWDILQLTSITCEWKSNLNYY